jgi:hypothetical protein
MFDATLDRNLTIALAAQMAEQALGVAQGEWRSGACVHIVADQGGKTALRLSSTAQFTAKVIHKLEGGTLNLPLVAKAQEGAVVSPSGTPVDSPASFTYMTPATKPGSGNYKGWLETISKRGSDKIELVWSEAGEGWKVDGTYVADNIPGWHCTPCVSHVEVSFSVVVTLYDPATGIFAGDGQAHVNSRSDWPNNNCTVSDSGTQAIHINVYPRDGQSGGYARDGDHLVVWGGGDPVGMMLKMCVLSFSEVGKYIHQPEKCGFVLEPITVVARDGATAVRQGRDDGFNWGYSDPFTTKDTDLMGLTCETHNKASGPAMTHSWNIALSYPPA